MRAAAGLVMLVVLGYAGPLGAQDGSVLPADDNPLAALRDELARALADADLPFSPEQERAIVLMMEDRRQASESLFGDLMNFRSGPTSGQEADRLRSAIDWMRGEFATRIRAYLTPEQLEVWTRVQAAAASAAPEDGAAASETQFVRINNNVFTSENFFFGGGFGGFGGRPEVIQRGGAGAWHGNSQFLVKDEALNARNPFAENKPPYQERRFGVDVGGPLIPGRLTTSVSLNYNRSENVGTVRATLADDSVFALGITRPFISRQMNVNNTYQIADAHSLRGNVFHQAQRNENQGIGDFTLPERGSTQERRFLQVNLRQFSVLSPTSLFESRVSVSRQQNETVPFSEAVRINVPDAFSSGGAQNREEERVGWVDVGTLYTRFGERLTLKAGTSGTYRGGESISTSNFGGTFNFESLDAFRAGRPLNYRATVGDPLVTATQLELGGFVQNDLQLTQQFSLMFGVRYDAQSNVADYDNVAPRVSFAYGIGPATVIRGGAGRYFQRLGVGQVATQRRLDGTRQYEVVIDDPTYPDPFLGGSIRDSLPSVRVTAPDLRAPNSLVAMLSLERTLWRTFIATVSYNYEREQHRFRLRNLNAPFDATSVALRACQPGQAEATCVRPDPSRGNVVSLESTGREVSHALRLNARYRFSIFNLTANYTLQRTMGDSFGTNLPTDNYDLRADWGRNQNARHQLNGTLNARLPLDVFLSGSVSAHSGRYYTITTGKDDNRDTQTNDRPPGVPRNSARGPRYLNVDFNLSKAIFLDGPEAGTRKNVNVFVNLTNAFNRTHYGTPSGVVTSPNFGRSTSADDPREVELGVRFQF